MQVLLTFTGFHDPYTKGLVGQEEQPGPILSLVSVRAFEQIILFSTPGTIEHTQATQDTLNALYPHLAVEVRDFPLEDPTDYNTILRGLRTHIRDMCDTFSQAQFFIAVASGTPQMHACWVLLAASGEIPAHILHVRPLRFVSKDRPLVSDIDVTSADFPLVRANMGGIESLYDIPDNLDIVVQQLDIVGDHPRMRQVLEHGAALASSAVPILLLGETGTGKELLADIFTA